MIALLHTTHVLKDRFESLIKEINESIAIKHYIYEDLLTYALSKGETDSSSFEQYVADIKKENPQLIICTCSSYGEESDRLEDIQRIDRPIAEYLVNNYQKIGLVYTTTSTKAISERLLWNSAKKINKDIEIVSCDCSTHWQHLNAGNIQAYYEGIATSINSIEDKTEVIFLAQASMEGVKKHLTTDKEVCTSPEYGISTILSQ